MHGKLTLRKCFSHRPECFSALKFLYVCYSQVCEVPLNHLPAYDIAKDKTKSCDICAIKGKDNEEAFSYCPPCDTIYCVKHHEV